MFCHAHLTMPVGSIPRPRTKARGRKRHQIQRLGKHQDRSAALSIGRDRKARREKSGKAEKVFRDEDCQRLELQDHIPAVVDQHRLDNALRGISAERLLADPRDGYPGAGFSARVPAGVSSRTRSSSGRCTGASSRG